MLFDAKGSRIAVMSATRREAQRIMSNDDKEARHYSNNGPFVVNSS